MTFTIDLHARIFHFETAERAAEADQWIRNNLGDTSKFEIVFKDAKTDSHFLGSAARKLG